VPQAVRRKKTNLRSKPRRKIRANRRSTQPLRAVDHRKTKGSQHGTKVGGTPVSSGGQKTKVTTAHHASGSYSARAETTAGYQKKAKGPQNVTTVGGHPAGTGAQKTKGKTHQRQSAYYNVQTTKKSKGTATSASRFQSTNKTYKVQHFNLSTKSKPVIAPVTFNASRHIEGSEHWVGSNYQVFRSYRPVWHDRVWWNNHYNRVVFVYGGWYYWNAGWWYPAWGYAPNASYAYDGPIYGYNGLPPDQVIANVQAALQQQGYYQSDVDGLLGPLTRTAVADYQRDHGLYVTSAVDRPTLVSLGMT